MATVEMKYRYIAIIYSSDFLRSTIDFEKLLPHGFDTY